MEQITVLLTGNCILEEVETLLPEKLDPNFPLKRSLDEYEMKLCELWVWVCVFWLLCWGFFSLFIYFSPGWCYFFLIRITFKRSFLILGNSFSLLLVCLDR